MTASAISCASLVCMGKGRRARLMREVGREVDRSVVAGHATGFHKGMHIAAAAAREQALAKRELLVLPGQNLTVLCLDGEIWLTRDRDGADHILGAGQSLAVRAADRAVLQALRPSRVRLLPA